MKQDHLRKFNNPQDIETLLKMRSEGFTLKQIATHFNADHTTIIYWLRKSGVLKHPVSKLKKVQKDKCPVCSMLLTAPYHVKNPCQ